MGRGVPNVSLPDRGLSGPVLVDYPDRPLNHLSTFFRLFVVIPIAIVLSLVEGGYTYGYGSGRTTTIAAAGGLLVLPVLLMILFRQKYPRWWLTGTSS